MVLANNNLKGFAPMPPAPYGLEMKLSSGEVARCIGESAIQGIPGVARRLPGVSRGVEIAHRKLPSGSGGSKIVPKVGPECKRTA